MTAQIIDGKVMRKDEGGLLVNIGYKSEGTVPAREMRTLGEEGLEELSVGDEIIAYVIHPEGRQGSSLLSIDRARGEQGECQAQHHSDPAHCSLLSTAPYFGVFRTRVQ